MGSEPWPPYLLCPKLRQIRHISRFQVPKRGRDITVLLMLLHQFVIIISMEWLDHESQQTWNICHLNETVVWRHRRGLETLSSIIFIDDGLVHCDPHVMAGDARALKLGDWALWHRLHYRYLSFWNINIGLPYNWKLENAANACQDSLSYQLTKYQLPN